jgi:hypothetical protein
MRWNEVDPKLGPAAFLTRPAIMPRAAEAGLEGKSAIRLVKLEPEISR